jgi:hypothetical protein
MIGLDGGKGSDEMIHAFGGTGCADFLASIELIG